MKKTILTVLLALSAGICLWACAGAGDIEETDMKLDTGIPEIEVIRPTCVLVIEVNGKILYGHLEDNPSAKAFIEKLNSGGITVEMHDYGNFEKVGPLPWELPRTDSRITAGPGDIILYQGDQITLYYGENSWDFTRLARIESVTKGELLGLLGAGEVSITFSLEWGE